MRPSHQLVQEVNRENKLKRSCDQCKFARSSDVISNDALNAQHSSPARTKNVRNHFAARGGLNAFISARASFLIHRPIIIPLVLSHILVSSQPLDLADAAPYLLQFLMTSRSGGGDEKRQFNRYRRMDVYAETNKRCNFPVFLRLPWTFSQSLARDFRRFCYPCLYSLVSFKEAFSMTIALQGSSPSISTQSIPNKIHRLKFHGTGEALFGIFILNLLKIILTLGIYYFWGKVKTRTFIWGQTEFAGDRFAYHGTGLELFLGWVKASVLFGGVLALQWVLTVSDHPYI